MLKKGRVTVKIKMPMARHVLLALGLANQSLGNQRGHMDVVLASLLMVRVDANQVPDGIQQQDVVYPPTLRYQ